MCWWVPAGAGSFLAAFPGLVLATEFTGLIVPRHDILVSTGVAAAVMQVQTEVGRRVKEGQLLVQLDDRLPALGRIAGA